MARRILLLGAGKVGRMIATFLAGCSEYRLRVADRDPTALARLSERTAVEETVVVDVSHGGQLRAAMEGCEAVVSALSFNVTPLAAQAAWELGASYFDLTEDRQTTELVRKIAQQARPGQVFMPQCGLAPGFISILASELTTWFDRLDTVRMRVGALPQFPTNALTYNLTWSTDGLINEYCNPCEVIHEGRLMDVLPLEGLEHFSLDGVRYEAFNTSGGLGTLCNSLQSSAREVNYKTIRYPGHQALMVFLLRDLRLEARRELLKDVLETAIPLTFQDVVITFCTVTGWRNGQFVQKSDARKIYAHTIDGESWSAIQITTAASICAVLDLFLQGKLPQQGFLCQEQVVLEDFLKNRFGQWYASTTPSTMFTRAEEPA
jgi:saccharopine dehydrogenase-like NADP-dependent oxidoreductase